MVEGDCMQIGQTVKVIDAFENEQLRRVVSFDFRNVYVCRDEEWEAAKGESRQPISIGFPRNFVLGVVNEGR
jgi:hypothetical protein